jgi:hypothetical protein
MLDKTEYSRLVIKRTNTTGSVPTIPPTSAVTLSQFTITDIMVGEYFLNSVDDKLWIRTENGISELPLNVLPFSSTTGNFEIISGQTWTDLYSLSGGTNIIVDWNNSNVQEITLTGSTNIFLTNGNAGGIYTLIINQGVAGSYTTTWNSLDTEWTNGVSPVMSSGSSVYDVYNFVYNGNTYFGSYNQNYGATPTPEIITSGLYTYFDGSNPSSLSGTGATQWISISGSSPSTGNLVNETYYVGDLGGGVYFDGIDGYVQTTSNIYDTSGFTYETWIRQMSPATEGDTSIISIDSDTFNFGVSATTLEYYTPSSWTTIGTENVIPIVYLLTITYDLSTTTLNVYRNSLPVYTNSSVSINPTGAYNLFGTDAGLTNFLEMVMYKVRTYDRPLSYAEVLNNWNTEKADYGY